MPRPQHIPSPKWTNVKAAGEFVELVFMMKAAALGLSISKPYGDNQLFDFLVTGPAGTFRVQVKSAWVSAQHRYSARIQPRLLRSRRSFDFLVAYVPPADAWYIIPARKLSARAARLYPDIPGSRGRFEKYRDAWHLLTGDPADDSWSLGLTIHAAAE
jgi:hypothetical protein